MFHANDTQLFKMSEALMAMPPTIRDETYKLRNHDEEWAESILAFSIRLSNL